MVWKYADLILENTIQHNLYLNSKANKIVLGPERLWQGGWWPHGATLLTVSQSISYLYYHVPWDCLVIIIKLKYGAQSTIVRQESTKYRKCWIMMPAACSNERGLICSAFLLRCYQKIVVEFMALECKIVVLRELELCVLIPGCEM